MKPTILFLSLAACFGLGILFDRGMRPAPSAAKARTSTPLPEAPSTPGGEKTTTREESSGSSRFAGRGDSPKVKALFDGYDRRKPVESELMVLQKIMAASPADLAEMVKGMSGLRWHDEIWRETTRSVMQRWVQLAPDEALAWAKGGHKNGAPYLQGEVIWLLAKADPARAMAEAQRMTSPRLRSSALEAVLASISQADPEKAFTMSQSLPRPQRQRAFYNLFGVWAERDPAAAAAGLVTMEDNDQRSELSSTLMSRWTAQDPASALAWAKGLAEPGLRQHTLQFYFGALGRVDPEAAITQISELPRSQQRGLLSGAVNGWMQKDPDAATAWVLTRADAAERERLIAGALSQGSVPNELASKLVAYLSPGSVREQALGQVVDQMISNDAEAAIAFTKTLPAAEEIRFREQLVLKLSSQDLDKALEYLKEKPLDGAAPAVWGMLAGDMAGQRSIAEALEWASTLPDEAARRGALPGVFGKMARANPAEAAKQATTLPEEATRLECLSRVGAAWAATGMEQAVAWAKGLAGKDREAAMGAVLQHAVQDQPTLVAAQFDSLIADVPAGAKPGEAVVGAAETIAVAYFAENQEAAAQWAAGLPQEDARTAAVRALAGQWAQYDPAGASEWIGTLAVGQPRDAAVGQLVARIASSDSPAAFAWASTVADLSDRSNLLEPTLASWRKLDALAARTAIEATDWSDEEKIKWLDKVK